MNKKQIANMFIKMPICNNTNIRVAYRLGYRLLCNNINIKILTIDVYMDWWTLHLNLQARMKLVLFIMNKCRKVDFWFS